MTRAMEHLEDDKLQRYFDGELTEGEAKVVRRAIDDSEVEQARLAQLERLSEVLKVSEEFAADLDSEALFSRIETAIDNAPNPRLRLIQGAKSRQRAGTAMGVAVAIAAAVAMAFVLRPTPPDPPVAHAPEIEQVDDEPNLDVIHHPPPGSSVDEVDFGANTGTVFEIEGDEGQPLAVVWIMEDDSALEGT